MLPKPDSYILGTHWGTYRAHFSESGLAALEPLVEDPDPSLIVKGMLAAQEAPSRIRSPSLRAGFLERVTKGLEPCGANGGRGTEAFVELPWDEALDIAASEIDRIRKTHGNQAIFGGSYGWASAGRFHHALSQIHRFLNAAGGYTSSVQNYSYAAGDVIIQHVLGDRRGLAFGQTTWPKIVAHTETLVLFGGLPRKNAQINGGGLSKHILREQLDATAARGTRIISISPIRDDTEVYGAEWWPIRPGTDVALMLGIAHELVTSGKLDRKFLERYTTGFEPFEAYLTGQNDGVAKSPDWAANTTGLKASQITELAHHMSETRTFIMMAWALQRARFGEQPYWMTVTLAAMLGQIGLPGGGFGFGYASVNGIGNPSHTAGVPALSQLKNPISEFIPVARIADALLNPGGTYQYNGQCRTYPDLRMISWAGGNPFHHHQDLHRLHEAWQQPETILINESWWTATARRADIVFPVATALERNDIVTSGRDSFLTPSHQMRKPYAESRSDYEIFAGLSKRLGCADTYTEGRDEENWLRLMYNTAQSSNAAGVDLPNFDTFWSGGPIYLQPKEEDTNHDLLADYRVDPDTNALCTPSGRIEIFSETIADFGYDDCPGHPTWMASEKWQGAGTRFPLHLISNQPKTKLHSQYEAGPYAQANKIAGRERLRMCTAEAEKRELTDGQVILVFNDVGACLAGLEISDDIRLGVAQISTGAWFDPDLAEPGQPEKSGNPNTLTRDCGASQLSQGVSAMSCMVEIEVFTGYLPAITVFDQPNFKIR